MPDFVHLHCHTQFSLLDGASDIGLMMDKAVTDGMKGIALTDHGNMFGAFKFVAEAEKRKLKPIVGCEFYLVQDRHKQQFLKSKGDADVRHHQLLLAKNQAGYQNLSKLCSLGFVEGMYGKYPRIDKELLLQYHEGLIATSCCIGAEIPQTILKGDIPKAEKLLQWWIDLFGEDYYIELQRHRGLENIDQLGVSQEDVNQVLLGFAKKYNIKVICTNDSHYIEEDDWRSHEILLAVNTGSKISDEKRFKFPSSDFYFKTQAEMSKLFGDLPHALDNTMEIFDKIQPLQLKRDVMLPNFPLPAGFSDQPAFLRHLVYQGATPRYGEITEQLRERLDFELQVIRNMGFDGYFLVVQDFITAARDMGVAVGPGRGSAAGSAVAYCLGITNIDPIRYNLLFERFLNPERVSMPDIDIDFDDEKRQKVIDWVVDRYSKEQVAQIITFGTMAARSSIKDVARVMDLPLADSDRLSKLVPSRPGIKLKKLLESPLKELAKEWSGDDYANIEKLQTIAAKQDLEGEVLRIAQKVEGSVRSTGIHAAGVIIAPEDISKYIPVSTTKESNLWVTQFDGTTVEYAGMLKMDFLGLKTLTIIRDTIENIVKRHGAAQRINPDNIPLDDEATYQLFQRGDMVGIFQFESEGMQKHLRDLKPTDIEDLIAMNALYRPGPMDYIPTFVARKHGREKVVYPHEWLEDMLRPTYGIMVYQEQIMQCAQIMAGYSLGQADLLRRAMGKKKADEMAKQRETFTLGAQNKGVDGKKAGEIFDDMEKFASYGFNRSHAAAYSVLAYQTAYLKTHYPAEFMASVLTHNKSNTESLNFFLRECKRMNIHVTSPDINESELNFTVNKAGDIRFGLSALKGVGEGPVEELLAARKKGGDFKSIFDMVRRIGSRFVNKRVLESLAYGGGFDSFGGHRAQYFCASEKYETLVEHALKYGNAYQTQRAASQNSLFGDMSETLSLSEPPLPKCEPWLLLAKLNYEKEVTGIFISGHPLDDFRFEIDNFTSCTLEQIEQQPKGRKMNLAGFVTTADHKISKKGTGWGRFIVQDYNGSLEMSLFGEDYQKYKHWFELGATLFLQGAYEPRWNSDEMQFRIADVRPLAEVGAQLTRFITLRLPLEVLDSQLIDNLESLFQAHKGQHFLKLQCIDSINRQALTLTAATHNVMVSSEFLAAVQKLGLDYTVN